MTNHIADDNKKVQPAPAPLPGEVETWDAELEWEEQGGHVCPVVYMRRVQVGQVAEPYVKHSDYSDLTRRVAECEDAVESERELYGTQLKQMLSRAEAAEARVAELVAEAARRPLASDDEQTISDLEAFKARVMAWARGDCCACSGMTEDEYGQRVLHTEKCYGCVEYGGDDDAVSLWAPAWEVGE